VFERKKQLEGKARKKIILLKPSRKGGETKRGGKQTGGKNSVLTDSTYKLREGPRNREKKGARERERKNILRTACW